MTGTIALLISIVAYGNYYLNNPSKNDFLDTNNVLQFCNRVHFIGMNWVFKISIARSINEWLKYLKNNSVKYLKLHYQSVSENDRMSAGFVGGGGEWLIEAKTKNGSDFYQGKWEVTHEDDVDKKFWTVTYIRIAKKHTLNVSYPMDLNLIKKNLLFDLTKAMSFAKENDMKYFAECFENGIKCLNSNNPLQEEFIYHKELIPDRYFSLGASQILACCQISWVFGGMGSWNDVSFEGKSQTLYEEISKKLFQDMNMAIVCATNSTLK
ncbi:hypothetical protein FACS1894172_11100 [Spirochaetia bacterium]|nr:hypothetical protein FACS1894164_20480 [Spirochaetia bacterium]GHU33145.1 hypothetical protein FACS1894172_11100 [Spirochaetia bacterium]